MVPFLLWKSLHGIFFSTSFGILSCSFDENRKVEQVVSIAVCFLYIHNNREKCNIVLILFVDCSEQKNHDSNNSDDVTLTHHDPGIYIYIQVYTSCTCEITKEILLVIFYNTCTSKIIGSTDMSCEFKDIFKMTMMKQLISVTFKYTFFSFNFGKASRLASIISSHWKKKEISSGTINSVYL